MRSYVRNHLPNVARGMCRERKWKKRPAKCLTPLMRPATAMSDDAQAKVHAELPGRLDAIEVAHALSHRFCENLVTEHPSATANLPLVLEELITNSVQHGRACGDSAIHLEIVSRQRRVLLFYSDNGLPYDPRTDVPRDSREALVETPHVGGMGWPLIRHYFELLSYARHQDRNVLELVSRL